jgi:hypothetical protein
MTEAAEKLSGRLGIDTTDFKTGIREANRELRVLESSFKASAASLGDWSKDAAGLEMRIKSLTSQIEIQRLKVAALQENYEKIAREQGENSKAAKEAQIAWNKQAEVLGKMERELGQTEKALVDVTNETKDAESATNKLGRSQDKTTGSTSRMSLALGGLRKMAGATVGALANLTRRVASMAVGLAVSAAKIAAATAVATGVLLASTIGPASDLNETLSKSEVVFASMSESVIKNSKAAANELGIGQKAYLDYASAVGAALTAGGMGIQEATSLSERAVEHFADLASFHNAEVQDVAESWQSAIRGSYEPIQKYFPFITNEYLKTYGTAKGLIDENTQNLTANQRAIILNAIALDSKLNPALGDFARTSDGLSNQQRILAAQVENAKTKIGSGLLPVVTKLVTALNMFLASETAQAGLDKIKTTLEGFGNTLGTLLDSFEGKDFDLATFIGGLFGGLDTKLNLVDFGLNIVNSIVDSIIASVPNILPAALGILQKLVEFLTQGLPALVTTAIPMLLSLITGIVEALPMLVDAALQIILALANGLTLALPTLLPTIVGVILQIVMTLLENLPLIIDAALQLIIALAQGLVAALPVLIPMIPKIVEAIYSALLQAYPMILLAALELIKTLAFGIRDNIPVAFDAIVQLISVILNYLFTDMPRMFRDAGKALVQGIWQGIKENMQWLKDNFVGAVMSMVGSVKKALGINSPATYLADEVGEHMPTGIGQGFDKSMPKIRQHLVRSMLGLANDLKTTIEVPKSITGGAPLATAAAGASVSIGDIYVDARGAKDPKSVGKAVGDSLIDTLRSKGVI